MQINWSLILNAVLLVGVIVAIVHVLRIRRKASQSFTRSPSLGRVESVPDEIIAVRRVNAEPFVSRTVQKPNLTQAPIANREFIVTPTSYAVSPIAINPSLEDDFIDEINVQDNTRDEEPHKYASIVEESQASTPHVFAKEAIEKVDLINIQEQAPLMMFLLAKANRHLAGYELLQAVLAAGLRFGEGNLFHRHQHSNGQGPIMCSLAAATDKGVFDLQNIGAFTVRGLCLYMHASGNSSIDEERFDIMLDTAKILSEDLDAHLLDDQRKPLSDRSIQRYHQMLNLMEEMA